MRRRELQRQGRGSRESFPRAPQPARSSNSLAQARQMEQDGVTIPVWRRSRVLASGLHFLLPLIFKKEDSATRLKGYYAQFSHPSQVSQKHKHAWMCVLAGDLAVSNPSVWTVSHILSQRDEIRIKGLPTEFYSSPHQ
ncbi:uncharacterized protein [Triticum aestivum]|uniref:uncharacterized protein isoform X3 n=1 Tax=Triticum aestivum TaxID=4565 RepID=UPI001D001A98|nr:uncharacterized protein LOC123121952 isoform X3 [Triticum aestivum]